MIDVNFIFISINSHLEVKHLICIYYHQDDSTVNAKVSVPATAGGLILGAYKCNLYFITLVLAI